MLNNCPTDLFKWPLLHAFNKMATFTHRFRLARRLDAAHFEKSERSESSRRRAQTIARPMIRFRRRRADAFADFIAPPAHHQSSGAMLAIISRKTSASAARRLFAFRAAEKCSIIYIAASPSLDADYM